MFKFFNRNSFAAYAMLPVVLVLFRLRLFTSDVVISLGDETSAPLWSLFVSLIEASRMAGAAVAVALSCLAAFEVNRTFNLFRFGEHQSNLGGFFYVVLTGGFLVSHQLHPVLVFIPLFMVVLCRLFRAAAEHQPTRLCFDAGLFFGIGLLCWGKALWLMPMLFVSLLMLHVATFRTMAAILMGLLFPLCVAVLRCLWIERFEELLQLMWQNVVTPVAFYKTHFLARLHLGALALLSVLALLRAMRSLGSLKIVERNRIRVLVWFMFYTSGLIILPYFSFEMLPFAAIFVSILAASMLQYWKNPRWQEGTTLVLIGLTLLTQWFG